MKTKNLLSLFLGIVLLISATILSVYAEEEKATVYSDKISAIAGETVKIPIYIKNNTDILGWKLNFDYNSENLTAISVDYGEAIKTGLQDNIDGNSTPGKLSVYWAGSNSEDYNGVMFYINFSVSSSANGNDLIDISYSQPDTFDGEYKVVVLNCENIAISYENENPINTTEADAVSVYSDSDIKAGIGDEVTLPIRIANNKGIMGYKIHFEYDTQNLQPLSVESTNLLQGTFEDSIGIKEGQFDVLWSSTENKTSDGVIFNIIFSVLTDKTVDTQISISYSQADTFNENWEDVKLDCNNVIIALNKKEDSTTSSDISIQTNPSSNISKSSSTLSTEQSSNIEQSSVSPQSSSKTNLTTQNTTLHKHLVSNVWTVEVRPTYFSAGKQVLYCLECKAVITTKSIAKKQLKTPKFTVNSGKTSLTVKYKKVIGANGFQIKYRLKGSKKWASKTFSAKKSANKVIKKLKSGKKYQIKIRAKIKQGTKTAYSKWSGIKTVKAR